jgi:hypothetical protein
MRVMQLVRDLFGKAPEQSAVSRFLALNGAIYIAAGAILVMWPGSMQAVFGDAAFVGREQGLIRVVGLTVVIIGVLYLLGGRGNSAQIIAVSILCRPVLVPATILPIALAGVFPGLLFTFVFLDMGLSVISLIIYLRLRRQA